MFASPAATSATACDARGMILASSLSAIPSRGEKVGRQIDTTGTPRYCNHLALTSAVLEGRDGADVRFARPRPHGRAEGRSREVDIGSGDDPAGGNQLAEPLSGQNGHVGSHPAAELGRYGLRALSCEAPDSVVTVMPVELSNSGRSCS